MKQRGGERKKQHGGVVAGAAETGGCGGGVAGHVEAAGGADGSCGSSSNPGLRLEPQPLLQKLFAPFSLPPDPHFLILNCKARGFSPLPC